MHTQRHRYDSQKESAHDHSLCGHDHAHTFFEELYCHVPLSIISVGLSFIIFTLIKGIASNSLDYRELFHILHYVHMLFASLGCTATFLRFSSGGILGVLIGITIPMISCSLSDIVLPALGMRLLGIKIPLHLCLFDIHDTTTLFIFAFAGSIAGLTLVKGNKQMLRSISAYMHFFHVFIGVLAALSYLLAYGLNDWNVHCGALLPLLFSAIVVPCTLSDVIVPLYITKLFSKQRYVGEIKQQPFQRRYTRQSSR